MQSLFKVNDTNAIELEDKTKSLQLAIRDSWVKFQES